MARKFSFTYNDKVIEKQVEEAAKQGVNETMAACILIAKRLTPVVTGTAQGSIAIQEFAARKGRLILGLWGSRLVLYFIWLEIGARGRPGIMMLRRAADLEYPKLAERIADNLKAA